MGVLDLQRGISMNAPQAADIDVWFKTSVL